MAHPTQRTARWPRLAHCPVRQGDRPGSTTRLILLPWAEHAAYDRGWAVGPVHRIAGEGRRMLEVEYAKRGDLSIAYQVVGDGPVDVIFGAGLVSHLDLLW